MNFNNHIGEGSYSNRWGTFFHSSFNLDWLGDKSPKVIIDVGAYDFGDSIRFKEKWPHCEVYAFEMMQENYHSFAPKAIEAGVHTLSMAVSNYDGYAKFFKSTCQSGVHAQSTLLEPDQAYKNNYYPYVTHEEASYEVPCITLDSFAEQYSIKKVDLLHEDTEGHLYHVLQGMKKLRPKMLFCEFLLDTGGWKGQGSFAEILELLDSYGYVKVQDYPHDKLFIHKSV